MLRPVLLRTEREVPGASRAWVTAATYEAMMKARSRSPIDVAMRRKYKSFTVMAANVVGWPQPSQSVASPISMGRGQAMVGNLRRAVTAPLARCPEPRLTSPNRNGAVPCSRCRGGRRGIILLSPAADEVEISVLRDEDGKQIHTHPPSAAFGR